MPNTSSDNTNSNNAQSSLENVDWDSLIRRVFTSFVNFFQDPSITSGISQTASEAIRNAVSPMLADMSSRGLPGMLGRISGVSNSPTLASIGNLMSMNPFLASLTGASDVRIAQEVAKEIGQRSFGMMRTPMSTVNTLMAGANIQEFWTGFADSNTPFKKGMQQAHAFLAANWLNQSGAIGQEDIINPKGIQDKSEKLMSSTMEMLSIGKNILGMGDDVYAILNQVSVLGGGKGKQFGEAAERFKNYISQLVSDGLDMAEVQATISHANGQIQALMASGYSASAAAAYARESTAAAAAVSKEMQSKGQDVDMKSISNKISAMQVARNRQAGGKQTNINALALDSMLKMGVLSEEQAESLRKLMANGELDEEALKYTLGANYEQFTQFREGLISRYWNSPELLASQAAKSSFGGAALSANNRSIYNQFIKGLKNQIEKFGPENKKQLLEIVDKIELGTASSEEIALLENAVGTSVVGVNKALFERFKQEGERKRRQNVLENVLGSSVQGEYVSYETYVGDKNSILSAAEALGIKGKDVKGVPEELQKYGFTKEKMSQLKERGGLALGEYLKVQENGKVHLIADNGYTRTFTEDEWKKIQAQQEKQRTKPELAVLEGIKKILEDIVQEYKDSKKDPEQSESELTEEQKKAAAGNKK
jgi:hypothetical protein